VAGLAVGERAGGARPAFSSVVGRHYSG